MWSKIVFTKSGRRRPVQLGMPCWQGDVQGQIPVAWCCRCGREIFSPGKRLCDSCGERGEQYEFSQSLPDLLPGEESGEL